VDVSDTVPPEGRRLGQPRSQSETPATGGRGIGSGKAWSTASRPARSISDLPSAAAVYCLYGGRGRDAQPAYVGVAASLRARISQHLLTRDSSVATGVWAVGLLPDHVTEVRWWEHPDFSSRQALLAAEMVAFDVLEPALRSRGGVQRSARQLYENATFADAMGSLFRGDPTGVLSLPDLQTALDQIDELERRIRLLERKLAEF